MGKKYVAIAGIAFFLMVCLIMSLISVNASNTEITKTRCDLIDPWLKPKSDFLENHWNKMVGINCEVGS